MGWFDSITDAIGDAASAVAHAAEDVAGAVEHGVEDAAGAVAGAASDAASAVESFGADAFSVLKTGAGDVIDGVEDAAKAVGNAVEDAAEATGGFFKKVGKYIGGELESFVGGLWDAAKDVGSAVVDTVKDVGEGLIHGVGGFIENLAKGNVGDAFQSLINGLDKALIEAPQRLLNGALDTVQDTFDAATHLLGPVGGPLRSVIDRSVDIVRTTANTLIETGRDIYHFATELPLGIAKDLYKVGDDLVHGNFKDALSDFGDVFKNAGLKVVHSVTDIGVRLGQGIASILQTAFYLEPPSRKLTDDEKALLREVYGDSIDVDSIRVKDGGWAYDKLDMAAHTVGNTIYLPEGNSGQPLFNPDGSVSDYGRLLIHETGHVWQSQNAGGDYISQSLFAQQKSKSEHNGDRNFAYEYAADVAAGKPFSELNPEQQAHYIEEVLGPILAMPGDAEANLAAARAAGQTDVNGQPIDYDYAEKVLQDLQNGVGAA